MRNDALAVAPLLLGLGPRSVVITVGAAGAVVSDGHTIDLIPAPNISVVDTTGAGDAFIGALATGLTNGMDLGESAGCAVLAGSFATTKNGARGSLPTSEELEAFAAESTKKGRLPRG